MGIPIFEFFMVLALTIGVGSVGWFLVKKIRDKGKN